MLTMNVVCLAFITVHITYMWVCSHLPMHHPSVRKKRPLNYYGNNRMLCSINYFKTTNKFHQPKHHQSLFVISGRWGHSRTSFLDKLTIQAFTRLVYLYHWNIFDCCSLPLSDLHIWLGFYTIVKYAIRRYRHIHW